MDYSLRTKMLFKFLKSKCILKIYIDNIVEQHSPTFYHSTKEYLENHDVLQLIEDYKSDINSAFAWANTPQGLEFWSHVYTLYSYQNKWIKNKT